MIDKIHTKRCTKCKRIKQHSEFQKDKTKKDGLQSYCKSCQKDYDPSEKGKAVRRCYARTKEGKAAHSRGSKKYQKTDKGKAVYHKAIKKYQKTDKGKVTQRARAKHFSDRHPNYVKARNAVKIIIRNGQLPRPDTLRCHYCPTQAKQYHHYQGYEPEHWLDVVPVCMKCHTNRRLLTNEK